MISIEKCKEILGEDMPDSEVVRLREALYGMVESILDNYLEEFANIKVCKNQSSTAACPPLDKALKGMDLRVRSIVVDNMQAKEATRS